MRLIVLDLGHLEQVYAVLDEIIHLFLGGIAVELKISLALVCLPGLPGEVLTNILEVLLHVVLYLFKKCPGLSAHHHLVARHLFDLGFTTLPGVALPCHRWSHDVLPDLGAVTHWT